MKLQVFGFAIVLAAAVAGADYFMQAKKTGISLGQMGVSEYVDSVTGRFNAAAAEKALKSRQKQAVKVHFPEAPEGWVRRAWEDGDNARLIPPKRDLNALEKQGAAAQELSPMMAGMIAGSIKGAPRLRRTEIWVYERGDEIIALRGQFTKSDVKPTFSSMVARVKSANVRGVAMARGYAFVGGVAFGEIPTFKDGETPTGYRGFSASMGENIMISVRAAASDESIRSLMAAIDYDGLNAMLDAPLESIGAAAPAVDLAEQPEMAQRVFAARRDVLRDKGLITVLEPVAETGEVSGTTVSADAGGDADASAPKQIEVGLNPVAGMPGQKCVRSGGNRICATPSE